MNWYYLEDGAQRGPITDADFAPLMQQGVIVAGTYLWCEGMADWRTYGELTGVAAEAVVVATPAAGQTSVAAYASPLLRILAWVVDWFVVLTVFWLGLLALKWVLSRTFSDIHARGMVGVICVTALVLWGVDYFTGRVARNGATFGQSLFGMRVVAANGVPLSFLRALGRFAVLMIANQVTLTLGQVVAFFDQQKRGLHDIVCGTVVLKK